MTVIEFLVLFGSQMKFDQEGNVTSFGKCWKINRSNLLLTWLPSFIRGAKSRLSLRLMTDYPFDMTTLTRV